MTPGRSSGREQGPIAADELAELFDALFGSARLVLLAVSGGSDSVALLQLAVRWRDRRLGLAAAGQALNTTVPHVTPVLHAVTVDHRLRPEAAAEARWVAERAAARDVRHHTVTWWGDKPKTGLQAAARSARYRLIAGLAADLARSYGVGPEACVVATAHHRDDQAETLLMRLARGSGVDGLAAMPGARDLLGGVRLVRPLLSVGKFRLVATLTQAGQTWLEDPSNERPDFERVRVRHAATALQDIGLDSARLALSARRLQRARAALEAVRDEFIERHVALNDGAFAAIDRRRFAAAPEDIRLRVLARLLAWFGGQAQPARAIRVEALVARVGAALSSPGAGPEGVRLGATLGGCRVELARDRLLVMRERGRRPLPVTRIVPGERGVWDRRFEVEVAQGGGEAVTITAVSEEDIAAHDLTAHDLTAHDLTALDLIPGDPIARDRVESIGQAESAGACAGLDPRDRRRMLLTLPSIRRDDVLLAVPHLGFSAPGAGAAAAPTRAWFMHRAPGATGRRGGPSGT